MQRDGSFMPTGGLSCVLLAWRAHQRELKAYLVNRLHDAAAADDLLQDVFLRTLRQGAAFCGVGNQRAWLFEVARNALTDASRLRKPQVPLPDDLVDEPDETAPVDALTSCIERVLGELPQADADAIRHCDLEGMKLQAYADWQGLTLPALKSRIQRARRRMRALMVKNCQVQFDEAGRVSTHVPRGRK